MLNVQKANEIILLDINQRQELELLYTKKKVNHSIIKTVSYIVYHVLTLIRNQLKLKINVQIVESKSVFGFCYLEANKHFIGFVSVFFICNN